MVAALKRYLWLLLLAVLGCGEADSSNPDAGNWTMEENALRLEEDLFVSDNEDFYFGRIYDVAVRGDGRIYVADGEEHHVKVLSPEGELLETIGQQGEGPGEFERPSEVVLARGDTLCVLDAYRGRVSVFSPEHEFEYFFMARVERGIPHRMMVPESTEGYLFSYSWPMLPDDEESHPLAVRWADGEGTPGDTLFTARSSQAVIELDGNRISIYSLPFGRGPHFALGPDENIHYAWGDSLRVAVYDHTSEKLRTVDIPFEAVPVTEEDREEALDGASESWQSAVRDEIPETKPAFEHFLVDDEGRYWFKRPTEDLDRADWWVADPEEERVRTVSLPSEVELREIRNGYAYGRAEGEYGEPALVRYRIAES